MPLPDSPNKDEDNLDDVYKFPEEFRSYYVKGYDAESIPTEQIQETVEEIKPVESDIDYNALLNTPESSDVKTILDVKEEPEEKKEDKKESTTKSFNLN